MKDVLAILGGKPVRREGSWPRWPDATKSAERNLISTLRSQRWTVRARWRGRPTFDQRFCGRFARLLGTRFCIGCPSGSAALLLALESLELAPGGEVIVPALTWIAPIVAVLDANLVPVFVDIDPDTYCISPKAVEAAITSRTVCILPVHYHCRMADMDELTRIAKRHRIRLIEDCAQAHGAIWRQSYAGTIGDLGAFSMHNDKLLPCGEGGAVVTDHPAINARLQALRLDGFLWTGIPTRVPDGVYEMPEPGPIMGRSCCMSEFQAAILLDQVDRLVRLNTLRERNGRYLEAQLASVDGLKPLYRASQLSRAAYYEFAIRFGSHAFAGRTAAQICAALSVELGFPVFPEEPPVFLSPLYRPSTRRRYHLSRRHLARIDAKRWRLPAAEEAARALITFLHGPLLGTRADMEQIVEAFAKVQKHAHLLPKPDRLNLR